jgi:hypothetical protein
MKAKIKKNTKPVSMYLNDFEYEQLVKITEDLNMSLTEWLKEAMYEKINNDSKDLKKETDELLERLAKRINDLK